MIIRAIFTGKRSRVSVFKRFQVREFWKQPTARLETRRNFFSNRVVEAWNMVPGVKTVSSFKNAYRRHREENA
jgi:hypothetical protein